MIKGRSMMHTLGFRQPGNAAVLRTVPPNDNTGGNDCK